MDVWLKIWFMVQAEAIKFLQVDLINAQMGLTVWAR